MRTSQRVVCLNRRLVLVVFVYVYVYVRGSVRQRCIVRWLPWQVLSIHYTTLHGCQELQVD